MKAIEKLELESRRIHHNASYSRYYPEIKNAYEWDLFYSCLGDELSYWIEDLQSTIKEKFGESLTFYQYGRQGATIAPSEWLQPSSGNSFGGVSFDRAIGDENNLERIKHVTKVLKFINDYWNAQAKYIPEWWKECKEANEYQKDIDEHQGKIKVMREVWVTKK